MLGHEQRPARHLGLDLASVRLVLVIADHRSLRGAARAIGISESALSHRLRALEDVLTVSLFHRSSEGVEPTNAGHEFFSFAREAIRILDLATAAAAAASRGASGRLCVGLCTSLSTGHFRSAVAEFMSSSVNVELQLVEGSRSRMIEGLSARTVDLAVMVGSPDPSFGEALSLRPERAYALVPREHDLANKGETSWRRIAEEPLLISTRDTGPEAEAAVIARLGGPGQHLQRRLHTVNRDTLLALVAMGQGIALMIESDLGQLASDVVAIPLSDDAGPTFEPITVYRDPSNDNPPLRRFWSMLKSRYSEGG